jgi:hypothetical protein
MPRITGALPPRARTVRAQFLTGGNGTLPAAAPSGRLARVEALLESVERRLAVQFQRIAEIQAQLDRTIADRPITPQR